MDSNHARPTESSHPRRDNRRDDRLHGRDRERAELSVSVEALHHELAVATINAVADLSTDAAFANLPVAAGATFNAAHHNLFLTFNFVADAGQPDLYIAALAKPDATQPSQPAQAQTNQPQMTGASLAQHSARCANSDRASTDYGEVTRLQPKNPDAWAARCWCAPRAAARCSKRSTAAMSSLKLKADQADVLDTRGFVNLRLGKMDDAIKDYDAALKLDPKLPGALYSRGVAKSRKGDKAGGSADISAAKAMKSDVEFRVSRYSIRQ